MNIDKNTLVKVINKYNGTVGYDVQDLGVHRNFYPNETKEISFEELERLSFTPGGDVILKDYLEISDPDVVSMLFHSKPEPEYFYTREDIKNLMETGTLDQFLDCLDFAPASIKEIIKSMSVELPLNDVAKRDAIKEKLGFDVSRAIEIKETKYDGEAIEEEPAKTTARRTAPPQTKTPTPTGRRYQPINKEK